MGACELATYFETPLGVEIEDIVLSVIAVDVARRGRSGKGVLVASGGETGERSALAVVVEVESAGGTDRIDVGVDVDDRSSVGVVGNAVVAQILCGTGRTTDSDASIAEDVFAKLSALDVGDTVFGSSSWHSVGFERTLGLAGVD
jgi:hypothetical protein